MKVGVLGLGYIGMPIASTLHAGGHEVFSWTRNDRKTRWQNSTVLSLGKSVSLDAIVIACGAARPGIGDESTETGSAVSAARALNLNASTHVYYISSGAVYGECTKPSAETDIAKPCTEYGHAKLNAEKILGRTFGDRFSALRVGNVVDWENPYGIFREISRLSPDKRILNFYGDVNSSRDYLEMNDFVGLVIKTIEADTHQSILNVGSGNSLTLGLLAEKISSVTNLEIIINWHKGRSQDVQVTELDTDLLKLLHGFAHSDFVSQFERYLHNVLTA
jgi:nucleoside-diphosphate-sugar epimerase